MNKTVAAILLFAFWAGSSWGVAQESDLSLRTSASVEWKIVKPLELSLSPEWRLNPSDGSSEWLTEAGLQYKIIKGITVGASYRLTAVPAASSAEGSATYSNRFAFDAAGRYTLGRFTPKARLRFSNFTDFDESTDDRTNYLRYRIGLEYNVKGIKLTPYVSAEFYQKLSSGLFSKGRYTLGAEYQLAKHHAVKAEYCFADKFSNSTRYHILEIGYAFSF